MGIGFISNLETMVSSRKRKEGMNYDEIIKEN